MATDYRKTLEARRLRRRGGPKSRAVEAAKPEPVVEQQRGGFGIAPGGVTPGAVPAGRGRGTVAPKPTPSIADVVRDREERKGPDSDELALKAGVGAAKGASKFLPKGGSEAPSHDVSPETRSAMAEQRRGERQSANVAGSEFAPSSLDVDYVAPGQDFFSVSKLGAPDEELRFLMGGGEEGVNMAPGQAGGGLDVGAGGDIPALDAAPDVSGMEGTGGMGIGSAAGGIGGGLGALAGGYGLYQGIEQGNPLQAGMSGAGMVQGLSGASGALGGPSLASLGGGVGAGIGGALGILGGGYGIYQGIKNDDLPTTAAGGLGVIGGTAALAGTGALGSTAAGAAGATAAAGGASIAGAATGLGAVLAVGIIVNSLVQAGILPGNYKPTPEDISRITSTAAFENLRKEIPNRLSLPQMTQLLARNNAPHGEIQMRSSDQFGGAGDYQTPASENWMNMVSALHDPNQVYGGKGIEGAGDFIKNLQISYGPTGSATNNAGEQAWMLQNQMAAALPDLENYRDLKTGVAPGGYLYQNEQNRLDAAEAAFDAQQPQMQEDAYGIQRPIPNQNQYNPYTGVGITPDGRTFLLSPSAIQSQGINPYTYQPTSFSDGQYSAGTPHAAGYDEATGKQYNSRGWEIGPDGEGIPPAAPEIGPYVRQNVTPWQAVPYNDPNAPQMQMQPQESTGGMAAGVPQAPGAGVMDPGVSVAGAGKRSPQFLTPELDNRQEAAGGKPVGPGQPPADEGVAFGQAGKRPGQGGMQVGGPRPFGGGRPAGNVPFGGMPQGGLQPRPGGARRPNQRGGGVV